MEQISFQKLLKELEAEAYGERTHGGKSMPPNVHFFKNQFHTLFQKLYSLSNKNNVGLLYDSERDIERRLNYLIERKTIGEQLSLNLIEILSSIRSVISLVENDRN